MQIGYYGVILPQRKFWQGFFLEDMFMKQSDEYLNEMRRQERDLGRVPDLRGFGAETPPFEGFLAALGAGISQSVGRTPPDFASISTMALSFSRVTGLRYFILVNETDEKGGATTHLETIPNARSADDARSVFAGHPYIKRLKREIFEREMSRFHFDKAGHA